MVVEVLLPSVTAPVDPHTASLACVALGRLGWPYDLCDAPPNLSLSNSFVRVITGPTTRKARFFLFLFEREDQSKLYEAIQGVVNCLQHPCATVVLGCARFRFRAHQSVSLCSAPGQVRMHASVALKDCLTYNDLEVSPEASRARTETEPQPHPLRLLLYLLAVAAACLDQPGAGHAQVAVRAVFSARPWYELNVGMVRHRLF